MLLVHRKILVHVYIKARKLRTAKSSSRKTLFLPSPNSTPLYFFFLSSREGRGEDDKDYGKIYIKRARNFMSLREKSLNIEKNQRMFKFKLILMERILYNLILILILE